MSHKTYYVTTQPRLFSTATRILNNKFNIYPHTYFELYCCVTKITKTFIERRQVPLNIIFDNYKECLAHCVMINMDRGDSILQYSNLEDTINQFFQLARHLSIMITCLQKTYNIGGPNQ